MISRETWERRRAWLFGRQGAYRRALGPDSHDGQVILRDLAKFCRAHDSTFHADPRIAAMLDGRREVWNRIASHLNLTSEQLWALYDGRQPTEK